MVVDARCKALMGIAARPGYEVAVDELDRQVHPADLPAIEAARARTRVGERFAVEFRVILADDRIRWLASAGELLRPDATGRPTLGVGLLYDISEQVEARERARRTQERLELVLDAGGAVDTWDWDVPSDLVRLGPRFTALLGIPADHTGRDLPDQVRVIHPQDRPRVLEEIARAVQRCGDYQSEYRLVGSDGAERWVLARGRCVADEWGRTRRFPGVILDITERRRAEEAQARGETLLRAVLDNSQSHVFAKDLEGRYLVANRHFAQAFGVPPEQILGRTDREHLGAAEAHSANDRRVLAEGRALTFEETAVAADGARRTALSVKFPLREPNGDIFGVGSISTDISARKLAEEQLRVSERRLRLALDAAEMGAWEVAEGAGFGFIDVGMARIFGLPEGTERMAIDWFFRRVHPDDRDLVAAEVRRAWETTGEFAAEFRLLNNGDERWIIGRGRVHDGDGHRRMLGVNYDVTAVKKAELHRQLLIDELNHRVKNTLAIVQGIAQQTFKGDTVAEAARAAFEGRLGALATAHNLLTRENWERALLPDLATDALQIRGMNRHRVRLDGAAVVLRPKPAVTLAMALHELCTNAVKHGALSNENGIVSLAWAVSDGAEPRLRLVWREAGGPTVVPPSRRGFGSRLIEQALACDLEASVHLDFRPEGLVCTIDAPLPPAVGEDP